MVGRKTVADPKSSQKVLKHQLKSHLNQTVNSYKLTNNAISVYNTNLSPLTVLKWPYTHLILFANILF